jgi:hypothetical protein
MGGMKTPGCVLGCIPGCIVGVSGWPRGGAPPVDPRDPPDPPDGGVAFCAWSGTADNAIARAQNATRLQQAIPGCLRIATISQMLVLFYVESR